jgi:predicted O-methyltransferase YrrM
MMYIHDVPRLLGAGDYANLGHSRGGSALLMASSLDEYKLKGRIYSIDLFADGSHHWRRAKERLEKFHIPAKRVEICKGSTVEWAQKLEDKRFNFVFIDADHCYDAVKTDFYDWSFLVKPGGWIAFHDTNQDFSHKALEDTVVGKWDELKGFHVDRIRTFVKPS